MTVLNAETQESQGRNDSEKIENQISGLIKEAAIEVRKILGGPGFLESI